MTPPGRIEQPDIVPVAERGYRLDEPYVYEWTSAGTAYRIRVPQGFEYDGATVPRLAWTLTGILPDGLHRAAALVHDWLYRHSGRLPAGSYQSRNGDEWLDLDSAWPREAADRMFGRMMREAGVRRPIRRMAYLATRLFGRYGRS